MSQDANQRKRLLTHGLPVGIIALAAFIFGIRAGGGPGPEVSAVERFADAWIAQDFAAMRAEMSPASQAGVSLEELQRTYQAAQQTMTLVAIGTGEARGPLDQAGERVVALPVVIETAAFGEISGELAVPVADGAVAWRESMVFPGLAADERLGRRTEAPERAPILAQDGSKLAEGSATARVTNGTAGVLTGEIGAPPAERAKQMLAQGFPEGTPAGNSGLELAFDGQLAGTPGGELRAIGADETRVLASTKPIRGEPVKTTIDPILQDVAVGALGDLFGGVAVLDARSGDVRALAGVAFSAPQPPGSTMKIVTVVAGLESGVTDIDKEYPVETSNSSVEGYELPNAHDEACGGTLVNSFAHSCNTVFGPMGPEIGAAKFIAVAEKFGFNSPPSLYNDAALAAVQPALSTLPTKIEGELELAFSAIGQGLVLATPLQMASVAQVIANDGVRSPTSIVKDPALKADVGAVEVTSPEIADHVKTMMVEVINSGTGSAGALPDVQVAGKTGTAELGVPKEGAVPDPDDPDAEVEQQVDAWFAAFAPADKPKLAIAVMIVNASGDGGTVAAPIARQVLEAAGL